MSDWYYSHIIQGTNLKDTTWLYRHWDRGYMSISLIISPNPQVKPTTTLRYQTAEGNYYEVTIPATAKHPPLLWTYGQTKYKITPLPREDRQTAKEIYNDYLQKLKEHLTAPQ